MTAPRVLDDRYELVDRVGTGGMAEVWRARDTRLGRDVAVKLLSAASSAEPSRRHKIEREARALAASNDPGIVAVYDYGEATDPHGDIQPYLVMELVDGPDLHQYVAERGPLPIGEATTIVRDVLAAVGRAHDAGVVHGDLKPANVFIGQHGPKVGDFGVARILDQETGTTTVAATPTFAAPEVLKGERATPASDVYSAGCLLFELLAGRPPYEGTNGWDVASKHMESPVPALRTFRTDVPRPLSDAVRRSMDKDPKRRYATAGDFAHAIDGVETLELGATVPVSPVSGSAPVPTQVLTREGPNLARVALLGPLAGVWDGLSRHLRTVREKAGHKPQGRALLLGVVALLIVLAFLMMRAPGVQSVALPSVVGKTIPNATAALRLKGFKVSDVTYAPIMTGTPGRILGTIPAARALVRPGSSVHLVAGVLATTPAPVVRKPAQPAQPASSTPKRHGKHGHDD